MKSKKACLISWGIVLLTVLTVAHIGFCADSREKQWTVLQEQIPQNCSRYSVALKYSPSQATLYSSDHSNIKSTTLPESERTDDYTQRIDFGAMIDGYQYSALLGSAYELDLINPDGRQIRKARLLRSKQDVEPEILNEGYLYLNNRFEIPFELTAKQLSLPTSESVSGTFLINIYGNNPSSYRSYFSTDLKGTLTGIAVLEGIKLKVSVTYKESLRPNDRYVTLTIRPFDEKITYDSVSGKITDFLRLRSATLVVEKIASDSSEIVLAAVHGDLSQILKEQPYLSVNKPVPAFARVDLIRHKLLTFEELCRMARPKRYIVLIFGDFGQIPAVPGYNYRGRQITGEITLDESIVMEILQRNLKHPPLVVFVCRQFSVSDLYEKWLGREPEFYVLADYSNPLDVLFSPPLRVYSSYGSPIPRPSSMKTETLRQQFMLPEDNVSVLVANDKGNLVYIDIDAAQRLAETLTEVNKLISSKK